MDERTEVPVLAAMANNGILWILLFTVIAGGYFLPTMVGLIRGVDQLALVFLLNLIATPLFIGWPAAMILACGPRRRTPQPPWAYEAVPHPGQLYGPPGPSAPITGPFPAVPPREWRGR